MTNIFFSEQLDFFFDLHLNAKVKVLLCTVLYEATSHFNVSAIFVIQYSALHSS